MLAGISIWQLLIVFAIIMLLFGTHKLRSAGTDLGSALSSFRKAVNHDESRGAGTGALPFRQFLFLRRLFGTGSTVHADILLNAGILFSQNFAFAHCARFFKRQMATTSGNFPGHLEQA